MKTILVDAVNTFVTENGEIFHALHDVLETYPNKKIILTNADDVEMHEFKLDTVPYEVFTLKHSPEKTDPAYFEHLLKHFHFTKNDVVYFEHNVEAVKSARSLGITAHHYNKETRDLELLKKFLDTNL